MGSKESKHEKAVSMSNQELKEENMECSATKDNATENNEIESQQDITNSDSSVHSLTAIDNEDQCLKFYEMYRKLLTNLPRDISKRRVSTPRNVCKKHTHPMPFNFFCETCFVPICSDCTVLCHDKTKGHDIKDIEIVLESHHDLMADLNAAKQRELSKLQINIGELERVKDLQDTNKDYVAKLINKKFEQYHKLLDQRKESLLEELSNQKADKASKLQSALQKSHQAAENLIVPIPSSTGAGIRTIRRETSYMTWSEGARIYFGLYIS
ncbi:hypothetical protein Btru_030724 [Bulinus truncatus]|nr:hypothetical protein Btru_030724 [Bulinus truncatus]